MLQSGDVAHVRQDNVVRLAGASSRALHAVTAAQRCTCGGRRSGRSVSPKRRGLLSLFRRW